MFIANPFGKDQSRLSNAFASHPPLDERIQRLEGLTIPESGRSRLVLRLLRSCSGSGFRNRLPLFTQGGSSPLNLIASGPNTSRRAATSSLFSSTRVLAQPHLA